MTEKNTKKTYLITGASSGIGRSLCIELSKDSNVILLARDAKRLQETLSMMTAGDHMVIQGDVAKIENIATYVSQAFAKYQESSTPTLLDGFAHCAGIGGIFRISQSNYEQIHSIMLVNYYAFMEFVRCLMKPKKKAHPFHIVAISSQSAVSNRKYFPIYAASKAALEASIRALGTELIIKNTNVNAIRPGYVDTPMIADGNDYLENFELEMINNGFQPMGYIPPEYVAKLARYLLSDDARYTTGMVVPINGGAPC